MRIAFFADSYRPYQSGVVRALETLKKELSRQGNTVYIFAPSYRHQEPEEGVFRFPSIPAPTFKEFSLAIPYFPALAEKMAALAPDVVHVHSPFLLGRLGAKMAKRMRLPLVFTYHTLYERYVHYFPFFAGPTRKVVKRLTKEFCNTCDLVVAPSQEIKEMLLLEGVKKPLAVIPTGIELEAYQNLNPSWLRENLRLPPERRLLISVGRLGKEKNWGFLLETFALVRAALPAAHLVIVGDGPERKRLEEKAKALGVKAHVTFTGRLPHARVLDCYAGAELFVFSSLTETQGLVILEAKAAGLPAVAVEAAGVKDFITSGCDGFLTPLDQKAFSEKVLLLLQNEALRLEFSRAAKLNAGKLSATETTRQLLAAYEFLLGHKGG